MTKKPKLVITGSAGFIGGYMVQEALDQGFSVVGIDNLSKYGETSRSFDHHADYQLILGDARDSEFLSKHFEDADHIIAGAAMIGGISYFHTFAYDLIATNERIIASTCDAAIAALKKGRLKKVTYLSSSMVYESTDRWPSREGDELEIAPPLSSYGFQKLAVEYFARAAWDQYGLPYTILRPFNCVGIGEKRALSDIEIKSGNISLALSHVVPDLVQKILKGQDPLHILGKGEQLRCYTYGGDLARGIISSLENPNCINNDFNLSADKATSVLELAELIWSKIHGDQKAFRYISDKSYDYDVQKRIPDVSKAKELLNFSAETTLDSMLDEVILWIRSALKQGAI
jgi:nucleoside-diphosphate-sugar epimerase